jgi:hypothetical protein
MKRLVSNSAPFSIGFVQITTRLKIPSAHARLRL